MAEPNQELALIEWVKILMGVAVTAVGSAWAWWRGNQKAIYDKIDQVEREMSDKLEEIKDTSFENNTKLAVLETKQANHHDQLKSISEDTRDIREKVDQLVMAMLNHQK